MKEIKKEKESQQKRLYKKPSAKTEIIKNKNAWGESASNKAYKTGSKTVLIKEGVQKTLG